MEQSGLWLDAPDALAQLPHRSGGDSTLTRVGRDLIEVGFTVLSAVQDSHLIDVALADYERYLIEVGDYSAKNRDAKGRQFRLVNFHLYSEAAMRLAKSREVMRILDFIFGRETAVHSSLTFQYGSMQILHRDTGYFRTFPENLFVGVWTAMQDIHPDSGPLSYVPGSHRFHIDQYALYRDASAVIDDERAAMLRALYEYERQVIEKAESIGPREMAILKKGDVAIWHPLLVHGGSPTRRPELKRHSMVVHCCPADVYILNEEVFFKHPKETPVTPNYKRTESMGRKHSDFGEPSFRDSMSLRSEPWL